MSIRNLIWKIQNLLQHICLLSKRNSRQVVVSTQNIKISYHGKFAKDFYIPDCLSSLTLYRRFPERQEFSAAVKRLEAAAILSSGGVIEYATAETVSISGNASKTREQASQNQR
jgi:hypothetical protein